MAPHILQLSLLYLLLDKACYGKKYWSVIFDMKGKGQTWHFVIYL